MNYPRLFYRVESPASGCKFVSSRGVLSRNAMSAHTCDSRSARSASDVQPEMARRGDLFVRHLYGDCISTPFISLTSDFYRALSLACQHLRKSPDYTTVWLIVISSAGLPSPAFDAYGYLCRVPQKIRRTFGDFDRLQNAVRMNSEYLASDVVPDGAILARLNMETLVGLLPGWLLTAERRFILPMKRKSVHRSWVKASKKRFDEDESSPGERRTVAGRLAMKLKLADGDELEGFLAMLLSGPRVVCDE